MAKSKNKKFENLVSEIGGMINSLKSVTDFGLQECKPRVDYIIKHKTTDKNEIEHLLDDLFILKLLRITNLLITNSTLSHS